VVSDHGTTLRPDALRRLYERHPWYASRSDLARRLPVDVPAPPKREPAAYTVGYEGRSIDGFFDALLASGVQGVVDVRANPVSRKYGFASRSMRGIAERLGLAYHPLPELGIAGEHRADLGDFAAYQRLLDRYESEMLPRRGEHLARAIELLRGSPLALLCMEKDVRCCHRGRLARRIADASGLAVEHL